MTEPPYKRSSSQSAKITNLKTYAVGSKRSMKSASVKAKARVSDHSSPFTAQKTQRRLSRALYLATCSPRNRERFFRDLDGKALRRGSFNSVDDLIGAITEYINAHNADPKPIIWTASANDILAKVKRARRALHKL